MNALQHWTAIREIVNRTLKTTGFCVVATANPDGSPHVAPIGSLVLLEGGKGYYFEKFPKTTRSNLDQDQRICILASPRGFWSFLKMLFRGRFSDVPGVRLIGRAGARRAATEEERRRLRERLKSYQIFQRLKGYRLLWDDMRHVREITIDSVDPLHLGPMTQGLWQDAEACENTSVAPQ